MCMYRRYIWFKSCLKSLFKTMERTATTPSQHIIHKRVRSLRSFNKLPHKLHWCNDCRGIWKVKLILCCVDCDQTVMYKAGYLKKHWQWQKVLAMEMYRCTWPSCQSLLLLLSHILLAILHFHRHPEMTL